MIEEEMNGGSMGESRSLYSILGVACDASGEAIEAAYRAQSAVLEQNGSDADASSLLRVAYDTLRNPSVRQRYDARQLALKTEAARVVIVPDGPEIRFGSHRRAGRTLAILALLLVAGLTYWSFRPKLALSRPSVHASVASAPTEGEVQADSVVADDSVAVTISVPLPPPPALAAEVQIDAPASGSTMGRPVRTPGFDAKYLAWSAFYVVRPGVATGSGVMVAADKILTNCHVLAGAALSGIAVMNSMTRKISRVKEYARLDDDDVCLLHAPGAGSDAIEWGISANLKYGDSTYTLGHPGGASDLVWSSGAFVRRMGLSGRGEDFLVTNNYCRPGSSGGPLFDGEGRLVGVVTAVQRFTNQAQESVYGQCFSVTEAAARDLLRKPLFPIAMAPSSYKKNY